MNSDYYIEKKIFELSSFIKNGVILLVTATELESLEVHKKLKPVCGHSKIVKFFEGNQTYYLGNFGEYIAIHVQCSMGSMSRSSSIITVSEALTLIKPKLVLMPGIAFGIDKKKQNIGDVLIAEVVYPYNFKRIGSAVIQRGVPLSASKLLVNRFKSIINYWDYPLDDNKKASINCVHILSGEELIDDKKHRDDLVKEFRTVKGGEMEGAGVYAACNEIAPCILVKGICDFADGKKGINKEQNQIIAIQSALSACIEVFSSKTAFKSIALYPTFPIAEDDFILNAKKSLFDIYSLDKEEYYIERNIDSVFSNELDHFGIWVHGNPGNGKSNLIIRNLLINKHDYIYISLASCISVPIDDFFKEILYDISSKLEKGTQIHEPKTFFECSKSIISILEKFSANKKLYIFIEEIPISDSKAYKEFIEKFFSIIINKMLKPHLDEIRFLLSSIQNPEKYIQDFHQKINQQLKFIVLDVWDKSDIYKLIDLIINNTGKQLSDEIRNTLLDSCEGSPRFIKKYFRNIIFGNLISENDLLLMISQTKRELIP